MAPGAVGGGILTADYLYLRGERNVWWLTVLMPAVLLHFILGILVPFSLTLPIESFKGKPADTRTVGFLAAIMVALSFQAYYNDWVIAVMTKDISSFETMWGASTHNKVLFWGYSVGIQMLWLVI